MYERLGNSGGIASTYNNFGNLMCMQGEFARTLQLYEQSAAATETQGS